MKNLIIVALLITMELHALSGRYVQTPFRVDEEYEAGTTTKGEICFEVFKSKGGSFVTLNLNSPDQTPFTLLPEDIVYPSCKAGFCRSQTLWAMLRKFTNITLFAPHATRLGFDPYNGKKNWMKIEVEHDHFKDMFGFEKALQFGFEHFTDFMDESKTLSEANVFAMKQFYDTYYFGPTSIGEQMQHNRRVYITFAQNTHVIMHRLNQTNEKLHNVVLVTIEADDYISGPPSEWNTEPHSLESYVYFSELLEPLLDTSKLVKKAIS